MRGLFDLFLLVLPPPKKINYNCLKISPDPTAVVLVGRFPWSWVCLGRVGWGVCGDTQLLSSFSGLHQVSQRLPKAKPARSQKKQQKHKDGEVLSGCRGSEQQGGGETGLQLRTEEEGGGGCHDLIRGDYSRSVAIYLGVTIAGGSLCQLPFNQKPQRKIEEKSDRGD